MVGYIFDCAKAIVSPYFPFQRFWEWFDFFDFGERAIILSYYDNCDPNARETRAGGRSNHQGLLGLILSPLPAITVCK